MSPEFTLYLAIAFAVVAFLYASVGHAGASGYIAVMTLVGLAPESIRPLALSMNILVATVATWQFWKGGHFSWSLFWPFALFAAPFAFLGGYLKLPNQIFQVVIGFVLLYSAWRFFSNSREIDPVVPPKKGMAIASGTTLGFLAGLTGTGGGIFLTPLLMLMKWANAKTAAAVSALFILVNSVFGLLGNIASTRHLPPSTGFFLLAAVLGGLVGSHLGSMRYSTTLIKRLLASVLTIAGCKLLLT